MKHIAKLSNCDECDYSCTKRKVPVMHKFRKHRGQEPQRKLCELCDFTWQTTGGLRFHQNAEHSGLDGPQEFKCILCDYKASKNYILSKHRIRKHGIFNKINEKKQSYSVKSVSFHLLKKSFLLRICTENMIVLSPSRIMSATYAITPSQ